MNIKKSFLSRIARRKGAARAEPEEGHGIPSPAVIEPCVPRATGNSGDKGPGSRQKLELISSGEPAPTGSANGVDAVDDGDAPALEALIEPVTDEPPDAPGPSRGAAPYEEYGLELELLTGTESKASPDESPEPALAENGVFPLVRDARGAWRPGKGFSRGELREAGLGPADASRLRIRFDKRRRNTHPVNVASLERARSGV